MSASVIDLAAFRSHRVIATPAAAQCIAIADRAKRLACLRREAARTAACVEALHAQGKTDREAQRAAVRATALAAAAAWRVSLDNLSQRRAG